MGCSLRLIARQRAGPKKILGLVFFFLGNPNAPQQVKFYIHDMALISLTASDFPVLRGGRKKAFIHARTILFFAILLPYSRTIPTKYALRADVFKSCPLLCTCHLNVKIWQQTS